MNDREFELGRLRSDALHLALAYVADIFAHRDGRVSEHQGPFDAACKALAAKLNEPETCFACGQEKPCE